MLQTEILRNADISEQDIQQLNAAWDAYQAAKKQPAHDLPHIVCTGILALVFADVNAGKSSLGNFVGGWDLRESAYSDLYQPHNCEIEDFSTASREDRQTRVIDHFAENATEATSTIQHYTLQQGLTWVDTPGLHSLTKEHGDLAKEYIQFADLVIYLTPSSSPFKADEREMLGDLFRMGKPVILAITKSDVTQQLVEGGRIVNKRLPKPDSNRKAQEKFVTEQVQQISGNDNLENSHILSLSVRLARDAVKAQEGALYGDSNLDKFLSQMGTILSTKAIELKMGRPKSEINAFIDRLIGQSGKSENFLTIAQLRAELTQKCENLQTVLAECKKEELKIYLEVERQLSTSLSLLFRNLRDRGVLDQEEIVQKEISANTSKLVSEVCVSHLKEKLGTIALSIEFSARELPAADGELLYRASGVLSLRNALNDSLRRSELVYMLRTPLINLRDILRQAMSSYQATAIYGEKQQLAENRESLIASRQRLRDRLLSDGLRKIEAILEEVKAAAASGQAVEGLDKKLNEELNSLLKAAAEQEQAILQSEIKVNGMPSYSQSNLSTSQAQNDGDGSGEAWAAIGGFAMTIPPIVIGPIPIPINYIIVLVAGLLSIFEKQSKKEERERQRIAKESQEQMANYYKWLNELRDQETQIKATFEKTVNDFLCQYYDPKLEEIDKVLMEVDSDCAEHTKNLKAMEQLLLRVGDEMVSLPMTA